MVKRVSKILMIVCFALLCIFLVSCKDNKEKADWAQKVKNRYARYQVGDARQPFNYDELYAMTTGKFGESNYGSVTITTSQGATGILYWIDGDYTKEEITERVKKEKKLKGLAISFAAGLAVDAYYGDLEGWVY